jgi:hypothetical protein
MIDCCGEIAAASESIATVNTDPVFKALTENASICMIEDNISLSDMPAEAIEVLSSRMEIVVQEAVVFK